MNRTLLCLVAVAVLVAGCASGSASPPPGAKLAVVTTSTVFADLVRNVGGDLVTVSSLVPPNADVHTFAPRPSDIRTLAGARLVVMNGLGLDDWLNRTIESVATGAPVVRLAEDLPGAAYVVNEKTGTPNPHLWMDVTYAQRYVDRIAAALAKADPAHAAAYQSQGREYRARLGDLDAWVKHQTATIAEADRRFVGFHDALPYYARAYGLEIVGIVVAAPGQEPSAGYTAQLIDAIRAARVKAIFAEAQFPSKLVDQIAQQTGATVVAELYDDSIGDPPVTTYEAIIRWDTEQFVKALA